MAHELSIRQDGFVEHAYVGAVGWHGLGNQLEKGASIEEWQKAAGMDWRLQRSVIRYATGRDQGPDSWLEMADRHVLMRSDTKKALSVVSDKFKIVQPKAILEFFRDLVGGAGYELETAGVLFDGKRFWAMAQRDGGQAEVGKGDVIQSRLLASTSCDGTMATEVRFTNVRVVCHNTLSMAVGDKAASRTTHRSLFNPDQVKKDLGLGAVEKFAEFMKDMRRLADTRLADQETIQMTAELFRPGAAKLASEDYIRVLRSTPVTTVLELAMDGKAKGSHFDGVKGTAYGWLQGVTEFVDHLSRAKSDDNRRISAWFGKGDDLKTRALEMALAA
jgi:phage/plasmid-like protein (TIGR03299 family)